MPPIGDSQLRDLLLRGSKVWNVERPPGWLNLADLDLDDLDLRGADLSHAGMWGCNLQRSDLSDAVLDGADLSCANLCRARLIRASVQGANFREAWVYGAAIWDLQGIPSNEERLSILPDGDRYLKSDHELLRVEAGGLRIAQFLSSAYSALTASEPDALLSGMVDALSARVALLLGRFTASAERLKRIASHLCKEHSIAAMVFDFGKPASRDLTESVTLWARMCSFIIADLTDPASVPHELASIIPFLPSVPVFPIIKTEDQPYAMLEHLLRYPWVRKPFTFATETELEAIVTNIVTEVRQSHMAV
jgi:Pentapeptide repeats (8 copies)